MTKTATGNVACSHKWKAAFLQYLPMTLMLFRQLTVMEDRLNTRSVIWTRWPVECEQLCTPLTLPDLIKSGREERFDARSDSETLCLVSPLSKLGLWDNSGAASGGFMHTTLQNPLRLKHREPVWSQNKDFFVYYFVRTRSSDRVTAKRETGVSCDSSWCWRNEANNWSVSDEKDKNHVLHLLVVWLSDFGELHESWGRPLPLISCSSLDSGHSLYFKTPLALCRLSTSSSPKIQYPAGMCSFKPSWKWTCRNWMCSSLSGSEARPSALSAVGLFSLIGDKSTLLRGIT